MKKIVRSLSLILAGALLVACTSTAPLTGRSQLKLVSDQSLAASSTQSYNQLIKEVASKGLLANNSSQGRRIRSIGKRVATSVEKYMVQNGMGDRVQYLDWQFNLINTKDINAFAMPGGKIAFYSGILPILKNDAGIAFVMGHEIGHVIGGHHAEGHSNQQAAGIASALTRAIAGEGVASSLVSKGLSIGLLKFNRTQEYEADKYGMIFMAMAGYNPAEAIKAEQRMQAISQNSSGNDFLSTHPSGQNRVQALQAFLPEAMKYYRK